MPPERRAFASPPRSPELTPISLLSSTTTSTTTGTEPIPPIHIPDSLYMSSSSSSYISNRHHAKESTLSRVQQRRAAKRQHSQSHEAQPRHQHLTRKQYRRLQDAHEEYHRQRELIQAQQQRQQQEQQQQQQQQQWAPIKQTQYQEEQQQHQQHVYAQSQSSSSSSGQYSSPYGTPFAPSQRLSSRRSNLSRSSSSSSLYHPSLLDPTAATAESSESSTIPRSRRSSPGIPDQHHHHHPPRRRGPYSAWTAIREKERTRLLSNLTTLRESLQTVTASIPIPLPSPILPSHQAARENLDRLHQRIQHRRARARETILYDLHQGVKVVEAQVHRQVEMVMSRLKGAPASKYAFALTNSFLAQLPHTCTGSILAQAVASGLFQTDPSSCPQQQQQQEQQESSCRNETESLSNDFSSIALAGQLGSERPSALASLGDPNGLSTMMPPGVAAACTELLSAALPSFIPSMVAPLVCVFSYQTPPISDLAPITYTPYPRSDVISSSSSSGTAASSSSTKEVEEPPGRKEFVYPWGHPNEALPLPVSQPPLQPITPTQSFSSFSLSPSSSSSAEKSREQSHPIRAPDPGIVVVHSKTWTQDEREALYLAATRFRLSGQWSKIREMMNLHRTDKEIETEYMKLYGHRDNDDDGDDDEDDDDHHEGKGGGVGQFSNAGSDADADDETDVIFMKFGGGGSAQHKRLQLQHLQSRQLHYDQLHYQAHAPIPQQELQHHHHHQYHQQYQHSNNAHSHVQHPPLHDHHHHPHQQTYDPRQRFSAEEDHIRIFKKEFMIDKRFTLEEIPMRI